MAISLDDEHFKKREKVGPDEIEEVKKVRERRIYSGYACKSREKKARESKQKAYDAHGNEIQHAE